MNYEDRVEWSTDLDAERPSAGQRRVARARHVAVRRGRGFRRANEAGATVALVAVLDPCVRVVRSVAALDARRRRVVRVLRRDDVGEDAGGDVDRARVDRGPAERDEGWVECEAATGEGDDCEGEDKKLLHVGVRR